MNWYGSAMKRSAHICKSAERRSMTTAEPLWATKIAFFGHASFHLPKLGHFLIIVKLKDHDIRAPILIFIMYACSVVEITGMALRAAARKPQCRNVTSCQAWHLQPQPVP
jgi:hypothetical protein